MSDTQIAVRPKASQQLAQSLGMEPGAMLDAIKAQCFKCNPANVTNEMLAAFVSVAAAMDVNPFLPDMLYAFPGPGGSIVPIMGPSGVYKKLMEHPDVDSWETVVYPEDVSVPPTHAVTKIWRKGRERPLTYTALLSEWKINSNPQWTTRPRHFLSLRSLKHAARQIIHGLPYDADDRHIMEEINVTNTGAQEQAPDPVVKRAPAPAREKKGAAAVVENPVKPAPPIEVETKPVAETKTEKLAEKLADPAQAAAAVSVAQQAEAPKPRAFLQDAEKITVVCEVTQVEVIEVGLKDASGTPQIHPAVSVLLKGGYVGPAIHVGGATGTGNDMKPLPIWVVGATVKVDLEGKKNKAGAVNAKVVRVEAVKSAVEMD